MKSTLFLLFLLLNSLTASAHAEDHQIAISEAQFINLGIATGRLRSIANVPVLSVPGQVVIPPNHDYVVSTAQAGLIKQINVAIGDRVSQGQILATIDSPDLLALQRQYLRALSEQNLAGAVYRRDKKLMAEGVIANSRFEESRSRYNIADSEASESAQLLAIAGMSDTAIKKLARQHQLNSRLDVYSPIAGVVLDKTASVGTRVSAQAPLFRVADLSQLWLEIKIPQERISDISVGDRVSIDNTEVTATLSLLGQSVNPQNQTVLARAIIGAAKGQVRPGQSVNAKIIKSAQTPAFKVPNAAIAQREGQSYIFIRNAEGFLVQSVQIDGKQNGESVISGALTGDEVIAVRGAVALKANWMGLGSEE